MMPTDENAIGDRAGGGSAVDHGNNPPGPGGMDLSGGGHVPKVSQRLTSMPVDPPRILRRLRVLTNFSLPRFPRPGAEAVHDHEAAGEVDGGRAQAVPGGAAVTRPRLAPHTRYARASSPGGARVDWAGR
jgi:hypothetical protein